MCACAISGFLAHTLPHKNEGAIVLLRVESAPGDLLWAKSTKDTSKEMEGRGDGLDPWLLSNPSNSDVCIAKQVTERETHVQVGDLL